MVSLSPIVVAGDIDFPGVPSSGSGMYSLADIYYYLIEGRKATIPPSFQEPIAGPASTMKTLKEIYDDIEEKFEQCGATSGQVLSTVAFFNTDTDNWGPQSGSVETRTLSDSSTTVEVGYYEQTDLSDVDSDLATGNIKQGVTVFGVDGDPDVADTSSGNAVEGEIMSGKVAWVDGSEVTGNVPAGSSQDGDNGELEIDIPDGLYSGSDKTATAQDGDLLAGNIKDGVDIFGTEGTFPSDGNTLVGEVKTGRTFYTSSGTIKTGSGTRTLSAANDTVNAGFYEETTLSGVDSDLATGNIRQGVDIFGIPGDPNVADTITGDAAAGDILSTKVAWVNGSEVTGTIETRSWTSSTTAYEAGYYEQTDLSAVDSDLAAGNIKKDVAILGIDGTLYVGNLLKTGDAEDGGWGEAFSYQTDDYGGGIVTIDNVTGLVWASYGDQTGCNFGNQTDWPSAIDWADALSFAEYSDWRMPNRTEINSIVNCGNYDPAINSMYFPNTQSDEYWSSTTFKADTDNAWFVNFTDGNVSNAVKTDSYYVRPVRGGIPPPWELNEANVNAMTGWTWLNGAAWSDAIADSVSWNKGTDNNTGNTGTYTPNSSGTLKSRMEAVVAGRWSEICTSINGVTITTGMDGATGKPNISALAIADCVDGARDLTDPIAGATWETRSATLKTWATASGHSALPAVDYDGENNEFETVCTGDFYKNTSTLSLDTNYCWGAACGRSSGLYWDTGARELGYVSCSYQLHSNTSGTAGYFSFRVVVRPAAE